MNVMVQLFIIANHVCQGFISMSLFVSCNVLVVHMQLLLSLFRHLIYLLIWSKMAISNKISVKHKHVFITHLIIITKLMVGCLIPY